MRIYNPFVDSPAFICALSALAFDLFCINDIAKHCSFKTWGAENCPGRHYNVTAVINGNLWINELNNDSQNLRFRQISKIQCIIFFGAPVATGWNKTGTSQVGAISKAQKAQNIFLEKKTWNFWKKFFSENVA